MLHNKIGFFDNFTSVPQFRLLSDDETTITDNTDNPDYNSDNNIRVISTGGSGAGGSGAGGSGAGGSQPR
jgi:hypothetical protein